MRLRSGSEFGARLLIETVPSGNVYASPTPVSGVADAAADMPGAGETPGDPLPPGAAVLPPPGPAVDGPPGAPTVAPPAQAAKSPAPADAPINERRESLRDKMRLNFRHFS